ncbi:Ldh family oxidoreductase [Streptomyces sp. NPDC058287]|uniref:Ldh family oxidoreductase n=1 Tax=unclassified Streptomyces TaxID=2593676 RepID=UPI0036F07FCE
MRRSAEAGEPIPEGWAAGPDGRPTTDASAALAGALLPFGDHRGGNVALLVELLATLGGGSFSVDAAPFDRGTEPTGIGVFLLCLDSGSGVFPGPPDRATAHLDRLHAEHGVRLPALQQPAVTDELEGRGAGPETAPRPPRRALRSSGGRRERVAYGHGVDEARGGSAALQNGFPEPLALPGCGAITAARGRGLSVAQALPFGDAAVDGALGVPQPVLRPRVDGIGQVRTCSIGAEVKQFWSLIGRRSSNARAGLAPGSIRPVRPGGFRELGAAQVSCGQRLLLRRLAGRDFLSGVQSQVSVTEI